MPPNRSRSSRNSIEQEGRILLAIQAIENQEKAPMRVVARTYSVPYSTLRTRLHGTLNRAESRANSHKLTEIEEESLLKWIVSMDDRGGAPRPSTVREMADLLLAKRGSTRIDTVGLNWVTKFIKRHPDQLKSRFSRRYDYQRAKQENPRVIQQWFDLIQATIQKYGILDDDIYNFDETGFAMGLTATAKVITRAEYYGRRPVLQPGNREWVTVVESISASGWALPPTIIFKAKLYHYAWFDNLPGDWRFEVSANGWTTDEIGLRWLQKCFIPATNSRIKGKYRLLILDGHGSHLTPQFDEICAQNNIISICMPPHSSHLLQPLDIGCFASLKRAYGKLVERQIRLGINHIDKLDFLEAYPLARVETFKSATIQNSFIAAGLVPLDADRVISKLNVQLRTPTPPQSRPSSRSSAFSPKTPKTSIQARRQASSIKAFLRRRSQSPSVRAYQAIDQLEKGFHAVRQELIILAKDNHDLRSANEKKKQKRARTQRREARLTGLSVEEAQELSQPIEQPFSLVQPVLHDPVQPVQTAVAPLQKRRYTCSICGEIGHKSNKCSVR